MDRESATASDTGSHTCSARVKKEGNDLHVIDDGIVANFDVLAGTNGVTINLFRKKENAC
jgi:hypothetical protein